MTTAVILGAMALGTAGLKAGGLTTAESFAGRHPDSVAGQSLANQHFPAGAGSPVIVIGNQRQGAQLPPAVKDTPGITGVAGPVPTLSAAVSVHDQRHLARRQGPRQPGWLRPCQVPEGMVAMNTALIIHALFTWP